MATYMKMGKDKNDEEIERLWRTLDLREKGMVKVEGILGCIIRIVDDQSS